MLARKFNSEGINRCPTPCRARNATRCPRKVPSTYGPDGSPNGVWTTRSSRSSSSAMSYRPLPPMMPIVGVISRCRLMKMEVRLHWLHRAFSCRSPHVTSRYVWIVLEEDERVTLLDVAKQGLFRRQRLDRAQIESHDPRLGDVWRHRDHVGDENCVPATRLYPHALVVRRVTGRSLHANPGHDRLVFVDQHQHARFSERDEIRRQIAGAIPLVRMRCVLPLAPPHHVLCARE